MFPKSALVIGASRGIGRQIALTLSEHGYSVGVAAKSTENTEKLPGTIYSVSEEIVKAGGHAIPLKCNVRNIEDIEKATKICLDKFGKLDLLIYNAGSILWEKVTNTPMKKFDLMTDVNIRGAYGAIQSVLPHMLQQKSGRIILVSPPIYSRFFKGKTPYSVGKVGMTVLVHGLASEIQETGVSVSALWPATTVESQVTRKMDVPAKFMRKSTIFSDACLAIAMEQSEKYNGLALIDEDVLRDCGKTDFTEYRCDPEHEPPRVMPRRFPSLLVEEQDKQSPWKPKL